MGGRLASAGATPIVALMHDLLAYKGIAVGLWLAIFFAAERLRPAAPFPPGEGSLGRRVLRNGGLAGIQFSFSPPNLLPNTAFSARPGHCRAPGWVQGR